MLATKIPYDEEPPIISIFKNPKRTFLKKKKVTGSFTDGQSSSMEDQKTICIPPANENAFEEERQEEQEEPDFSRYLEVFKSYLESNSGGRKDTKSVNNEVGQLRRMVEVVMPGENPHYLGVCDLKEVERLWIKEHAPKKGYEPGTIRSYLLTLGHFFDFLIRSKVTPNVPNTVPVTKATTQHMQVCRDEVAKWRHALRPEEEVRQFEVMMDDGDNMISQEEFCSIVNSEFYKTIAATISEISKNYSSTPNTFTTTRTTFTNIRDSIFFHLIVTNISRSGAIANMTMEEFDNGKYSPTGQFVVLVKKHKTARKYGPCQVVIKKEVKVSLDTYINIVRNSIPGNKAKEVFITWSGCPLESGAISAQLHSFFVKCLDDTDSRSKRISATLVRKSLLTFVYDNLPDMKEPLGHLMKHNPSTGSKFYHLTRLRKVCYFKKRNFLDYIYQNCNLSNKKNTHFLIVR